ncbi:flagellin [Ureibacillus sp. FSL K6-3587]|uniref:flagellin N-terminal helical domain-containing protein n=1 Tax=Ureibacillus sp. FSL K6-3587 TaxID=2954681 RepID=UPI003158C4B8
MRIQHNISALNTHRNLTFNNSQSAKNLEKLSSGYKINRAGDDAAGLAISEKMRAQIRGLDMASKNSQDAISLIQTAEGALNETHSILQRMRELAVQSANDTNVKDDREALQKEIDQLVQEIDRIAKTTEFNTQKLLDGSFKGTFQIGANESQTMELNVGNMGAAALGLTASTTVQTGVAAADTTKALADGVYTVSGTDLKDADGNVVGSIAKNVVTANGTTYTFDKAQAVANNSTIIVKDGEATLVTNFGDSDDAKKLSAGTYEISGTNVLKDGKVVGEFDTTNKTVKIGDVELAAADLNVVGSDDGDFQDGDQFVINGVNISTREQAEGTISKIDEAIKSVSEQRATLGAVQNRLEHTINNLGTASENLTAAESRIRDTDMAKEMMEFTKNNILMQAAQAMLAQANQQPQGVLQLLQ